MSRRHHPALPLIALGVMVVVAVVVTLLTRRPIPEPAETVTLPSLLFRGRALGWEVHHPFQEPDDSIGALFIDHMRNPSASLPAGVNQPGALYVVETASPEAAQKRADGMMKPPWIWGRFCLQGDEEMAHELVGR